MHQEPVIHLNMVNVFDGLATFVEGHPVIISIKLI